MRLTIIALTLMLMIPSACVPAESERIAMAPCPAYYVLPSAKAVERPKPIPRVNRPSRKPTPRPKPRAHSWFPHNGRISKRWTHVVIHHSGTDEGGAKRFDAFHRKQNGWDELGYHFVIGNGTDTPDGAIEVGPRWHKQKHGAHCKTPDNYYNEHGIGICLVGDFTASSPSRAQLAALNSLVRFLADQRDLSPSRIVTHKGVTRRTACPGDRFSLSAVRRALAHPSVATSRP